MKRRLMRMDWSVFAQADREAIFDYIEADSPQAAITVDDRIRQQVETLTRFPESGRSGRVEGTRELVITRRPILSPTASWAIPSGSCACCTAPSNGPKICPKN